jgi:two-component system nitrate/nitrite response regulator NarL
MEFLPPVTTSVASARLSAMFVSEVRFLRESLAEVLSRYSIVDFKAQCASLAEALRAIEDLQPKILLLDVAFPDPLSTVAKFAAVAPACAIVALAIVETEQNVLAWAEAGAAGYVPSSASVDELVARLEQIGRGEQTCTPRISGGLMRRIAAGAHSPTSAAREAALTRREAEIFVLIGQGLSNKEIARRLGVSVGTTKSHVHNMLLKLSLRRRGEATRAYSALGRDPPAPPP